PEAQVQRGERGAAAALHLQYAVRIGQRGGCVIGEIAEVDGIAAGKAGDRRAERRAREYRRIEYEPLGRAGGGPHRPRSRRPVRAAPFAASSRIEPLMTVPPE